MQIPVLIESLPGSGYRASGGEPFGIVAEGATAEEALARFHEGVTTKLRNGARLAAVEVEATEHPWLRFAGMFDEADPLVQEWLETIQQERERDEAST